MVLNKEASFHHRIFVTFLPNCENGNVYFVITVHCFVRCIHYSNQRCGRFVFPLHIQGEPKRTEPA